MSLDCDRDHAVHQFLDVTVVYGQDQAASEFYKFIIISGLWKRMASNLMSKIVNLS